MKKVANDPLNSHDIKELIHQVTLMNGSISRLQALINRHRHDINKLKREVNALSAQVKPNNRLPVKAEQSLQETAQTKYSLLVGLIFFLAIILLLLHFMHK